MPRGGASRGRGSSRGRPSSGRRRGSSARGARGGQRHTSPPTTPPPRDFSPDGNRRNRAGSSANRDSNPAGSNAGSERDRSRSISPPSAARNAAADSAAGSDQESITGDASQQLVDNFTRTLTRHIDAAATRIGRENREYTFGAITEMAERQDNRMEAMHTSLRNEISMAMRGTVPPRGTLDDVLNVIRQNEAAGLGGNATRLGANAIPTTSGSILRTTAPSATTSRSADPINTGSMTAGLHPDSLSIGSIGIPIGHSTEVAPPTADIFNNTFGVSNPLGFNAELRSAPLTNFALPTPTAPLTYNPKKNPEFDGDKPEPLQFLDEFARYCQPYGDNPLVLLRRILPSCLKGKAMSWYKDFHLTWTTYEQFHNEFIECFCNSEKYTKLKAQVLTAAQLPNENVLDFLTKKNLQMQQFYPRMSDQERTIEIRKLLNPWFSAKLIPAVYFKYTELYRACIVLRDQRARDRAYNPPADCSTELDFVQTYNAKSSHLPVDKPVATRPSQVTTRLPYAYAQTPTRAQPRPSPIHGRILPPNSPGTFMKRMVANPSFVPPKPRAWNEEYLRTTPGARAASAAYLTSRTAPGTVPQQSRPAAATARAPAQTQSRAPAPQSNLRIVSAPPRAPATTASATPRPAPRVAPPVAKTPIVCYKCNQPGHMSRECPSNEVHYMDDYQTEEFTADENQTDEQFDDIENNEAHDCYALEDDFNDIDIDDPWHSMEEDGVAVGCDIQSEN